VLQLLNEPLQMLQLLKEDPAIKAKRTRRKRCQFLNKGHIQANTANIKNEANNGQHLKG